MAEGLPTTDDDARETARSRYLSSLGRRLDGVRTALEEFAAAPQSPPLRDNLRRRLHALGTAARVLDFTEAARAFGEAEGLAAGHFDDATLERLTALLERVSTASMGATVSVERSRSEYPLSIASTPGGWPISVVAFAPNAVAAALEDETTPGAELDTETTTDVDVAEEMVRAFAPDVTVVDADLPGARDLIEALGQDLSIEPTRVVVLGTYDRPDAAAPLLPLGVARVMPKPVSPQALRRAILALGAETSAGVALVAPLGDLSIEGLSERIAAEIRRGLVGAANERGQTVAIPFGEGTEILAAVWSAVARVREVATMRSGGSLRFDALGPEGAIPLAPWMDNSQERAHSFGDVRLSDGVSLEARRIVVIDDDPAVVWFIGGLFRAAGAFVIEAHDGHRGLQLVHENWPDLVVSDIVMPALDGFSLCRDIKRDVALSDVPVVLLSWKEDLLQKVRELGADADGYLKKEASASTIVRRVKEVLRARARIEKRLLEDLEVRGRLDGVTPRLILQLTCGAELDARVAIRDAAYLYEVDVRKGRPVAATRTDTTGRVEKGESVLGGLLGVRAGRFVVTRDESATRSDFHGDLVSVLSPTIFRIRAAQRALRKDTWPDIGRVEIDDRMLAAYVTTLPGRAKAMVERLADGIAPRHLIDGDDSVQLLEPLLQDLARHGAIASVHADDGRNLLDAVLGAVENSRVSQYPEFATPSPHTVFDSAPPIAEESPTALPQPEPPPQPSTPKAPLLPKVPQGIVSAEAADWRDALQARDTATRTPLDRSLEAHNLAASRPPNRSASASSDTVPVDEASLSPDMDGWFDDLTQSQRPSAPAPANAELDFVPDSKGSPLEESVRAAALAMAEFVHPTKADEAPACESQPPVATPPAASAELSPDIGAVMQVAQRVSSRATPPAPHSYAESGPSSHASGDRAPASEPPGEVPDSDRAAVDLADAVLGEMFGSPPSAAPLAGPSQARADTPLSGRSPTAAETTHGSTATSTAVSGVPPKREARFQDKAGTNEVTPGSEAAPSNEVDILADVKGAKAGRAQGEADPSTALPPQAASDGAPPTEIQQAMDLPTAEPASTQGAAVPNATGRRDLAQTLQSAIHSPSPETIPPEFVHDAGASEPPLPAEATLPTVGLSARAVDALEDALMGGGFASGKIVLERELSGTAERALESVPAAPSRELEKTLPEGSPLQPAAGPAHPKPPLKDSSADSLLKRTVREEVSFPEPAAKQPPTPQPPPAEMHEKEPREAASRKKPPTKTAPSASTERTRELPLWAVAALGVTAMGVAFVGTRTLTPLLRKPIEPTLQASAVAGDPAPPSDSSASTPAVAAGAPHIDVRPPHLQGKAPTTTPRAELSVSEGPLPAGVTVSEGRGMLEVVTRGRERIYVGGTFMGTGPIRRTAIPAGEHRVEIQLDGEQTSRMVPVRAGTLTHVSQAGSE